MRRVVIFLGFFSFLFLVRTDAIMLSPGAESVLEPVLFLAQQTQPPLDISGIAIIQAIPVGGSIFRTSQKAITILDSIANLAVMQFDVEKYSIEAINPYTNQKETVVGGEFGRILRHEILGFDPKREGLLVEHVEFVQTPGLTPKFDEDKYELWINDREIDLILVRDFGRPDKGFPEWGVLELELRQYVKDSGNPPKTEERSLSIDPEGTYYTIRILAPDGKLISWKKWKFVPGNPNPVAYWEGKGP